jgi:hypothetical protein
MTIALCGKRQSSAPLYVSVAGTTSPASLREIIAQKIIGSVWVTLRALRLTDVLIGERGRRQMNSVFVRCDRLKMPRIAACLVLACVMEFEPVRYSPIEQFITNAMRSTGRVCVVIQPNSYRPISILVEASSVVPAPTSLVNEEAGNQSLRERTNLISAHDNIVALFSQSVQREVVNNI